MAGQGCLTCHDKAPSSATFRHPDGLVKCLLCAQGCTLRPGQRGRCRARENVGGELKSLVYGRPITFQVDPIEKKPFYHFLPGALAFSLATAGCPLSCEFCQNWEISQSSPEDHAENFVPVDNVAQEAKNRRASVVAFTYNEPTVFFEYMIDVAKAARARGLRPVLISCGFMNEAPLSELTDVLDAIKIDLKGFSEDFYRNVSKARLAPVLRSIKQIARSRAHLEIVNLVVPTLNDSDASLKNMVAWLSGEIGNDVAVHFTRFHPDYKLLNLPPTPIATLTRARDLAMAQGLRYAYVGNAPGHPGAHTYCPSCKKIVIRRSAIFLEENRLVNGCCPDCRFKIAGVWS
jgi:pyruvate formate lyase activating enzyme